MYLSNSTRAAETVTARIAAFASASVNVVSYAVVITFISVW